MCGSIVCSEKPSVITSIGTGPLEILDAIVYGLKSDVHVDFEFVDIERAAEVMHFRSSTPLASNGL